MIEDAIKASIKEVEEHISAMEAYTTDFAQGALSVLRAEKERLLVLLKIVKNGK